MWEYRFKEYGKGRSAKVKIPLLSESKEFKKHLRDRFMRENPYASNWLDSVIRTAYSIMRSWRKRYMRGRAKKAKPLVRRRFARCKTTLMKVDYDKKP